MAYNLVLYLNSVYPPDLTGTILKYDNGFED